MPGLRSQCRLAGQRSRLVQCQLHTVRVLGASQRIAGRIFACQAARPFGQRRQDRYAVHLQLTQFGGMRIPGVHDPVSLRKERGFAGRQALGRIGHVVGAQVAPLLRGVAHPRGRIELPQTLLYQADVGPALLAQATQCAL